MDITTNGPNGLDTGSEAPSTWYAVFVIADSFGINPPAGLFSTSATAPLLPEGFDKFRRIGWVRNDAAGNFIDFAQHGAGQDRRYLYQNRPVDRQVLVGGAAIVWAVVSCAAFVPPTSTEGLLYVRNEGLTLLFVGKTSAGPTVRQVLPLNDIVTPFPLTAAQAISYGYLAGGGNATIRVSGWSESV